MSSRIPLTPYQRRLVLFLGVATFFEGFDHMALAQLLPTMRTEMNLGDQQTGLLVALTNVGTVLAYFVVRLADRVGRKPVLTLTVAGYTLCTLLTGLSSGPVAYGVLQFLARIFLIGEWGVSMVYAAEAFPAERRGEVLGILNAGGALGAVICAGVVPMLVRAPWGWRTVYFVGAIPLLLLAIARRSLRETDRFAALSADARSKPSRLTAIWRSPYRTRMLQLAVIWASAYVCTQTVVVFFKQYCVEEKHFDDRIVGALIAAAALFSMPMVFLIGSWLDRFGRRTCAVGVCSLMSLGAIGSYTLDSIPLLFLAVATAIFGAAAILPVLNAYSTELFPTELRGDAFAWSNNLLGRLSYVIAPLAVGAAAPHFGWALSVASTSVGPMIALALILWWLPETRGRELEDTARLA